MVVYVRIADIQNCELIKRSYIGHDRAYACGHETVRKFQPQTFRNIVEENIFVTLSENIFAILEWSILLIAVISQLIAVEYPHVDFGSSTMFCE